MQPIERALASIREDRRADYLWPTKTAAEAVGCVPNKFNDWWQRTESKLLALFVACPGETAAELAAICAKGAAKLEAERHAGTEARRHEGSKR